MGKTKSMGAPAGNTNAPSESARTPPGHTIRRSHKSGDPLPTPQEEGAVGHDKPLPWAPVDNGGRKPFKI